MKQGKAKIYYVIQMIDGKIWLGYFFYEIFLINGAVTNNFQNVYVFSKL